MPEDTDLWPEYDLSDILKDFCESGEDIIDLL
jgi:hypothetical protein